MDQQIKINIKTAVVEQLPENPLYLGSFNNYAALIALHPVGIDGNFAFIKDVFSFMAWKTSVSSWVTITNLVYVDGGNAYSVYDASLYSLDGGNAAA